MAAAHGAAAHGAEAWRWSGLAIAVEMTEAGKDCVEGIQVSLPFGRVQIVRDHIGKTRWRGRFVMERHVSGGSWAARSLLSVFEGHAGPARGSGAGLPRDRGGTTR